MAQRNEGEGSRAQDHSKRTRVIVRTGRARKSARKAEAALDTPEGTQMQAAEIKGKRESRGEDPKLYQKAVPGRDPKPDSDPD